VRGEVGLSRRVASFGDSIISEMSQLSMAHEAVNLVQGFPDFGSPPELLRAAQDAIAADHNQYPHPVGEPAFREAIAGKVARTYPGWEVDPLREICVTCGATEGLLAACIALLDAGDEVVVFEPWYENYWPDPQLCGAEVRFVPLHEPDWSIDEAELRAAFGPRTKLVIICTPNNPTGKVFSRAELGLIGELCQRWGAYLISDEIYEHIQYLGPGGHVPAATVPGLEDRTVTVNSMSKTYGVTGWRVGWSIAPAPLTGAIRKVHEYMTIGAATPLQEAGVVAMGLPPSYYERIAADYLERRDVLCEGLERIGFRLRRPDGAYYVFCDTGELDPARDADAFARRLITEIGVSSVPSGSFYRPENVEAGRSKLRFAFPKRIETLRAAISRLEALRPT
jgi:aspartate/methionine/tyrosine aminotransferase